MADRGSAGIFAELFRLIDREIADEGKRIRLARKYWAMSLEYDFSPSQLECDAALIRLGLARRGVDPAYPEDGPVTLYRGDDGF